MARQKKQPDPFIEAQKKVQLAARRQYAKAQADAAIARTKAAQSRTRTTESKTKAAEAQALRQQRLAELREHKAKQLTPQAVAKTEQLRKQAESRDRMFQVAHQLPGLFRGGASTFHSALNIAQALSPKAPPAINAGGGGGTGGAVQMAAVGLLKTSIDQLRGSVDALRRDFAQRRGGTSSAGGMTGKTAPTKPLSTAAKAKLATGRRFLNPPLPKELRGPQLPSANRPPPPLPPPLQVPKEHLEMARKVELLGGPKTGTGRMGSTNEPRQGRLTPKDVADRKADRLVDALERLSARMAQATPGVPESKREANRLAMSGLGGRRGGYRQAGADIAASIAGGQQGGGLDSLVKSMVARAAMTTLIAGS